jgi:hypothetical protein
MKKSRNKDMLKRTSIETAIEKTDINKSEEVRVTTPFCYENETPKCQKTEI